MPKIFNYFPVIVFITIVLILYFNKNNQYKIESNTNLVINKNK